MEGIGMNEQEVKELFEQGFDCSQVVLSHYANTLGIDVDMARKVSACFGGGMMAGETCGAITGALMAIGLKYGHYKPQDKQQKEIVKKKLAQFREEYQKSRSVSLCREILGHDFTKPGEMEIIKEGNLIDKICPRLVVDITDILDNIL
jgi:C_GCAxxG_C_C family probable redox protein